ncbi:unnamed protein product [Victoria cruziana]
MLFIFVEEFTERNRGSNKEVSSVVSEQFKKLGHIQRNYRMRFNSSNYVNLRRNGKGSFIRGRIRISYA